MNTNEYGIALDRNGYAPTILQKEKRCRICGRICEDLQRHEIFNGALRQKSKAYGLWCWLCSTCHWRITHEKAYYRILLKEISENQALEYYNWTMDEYHARFGKNYIDAETFDAIEKEKELRQCSIM